MKKILLLTLLTALCFSQTEEWIYYSNSEGVNKVKPDGSENELVMEGFFMRDLSYDKSKLLVTDNSSNSVSIVDIETMNTQTIAFAEISPKNLHFTVDQNVIYFTDNYYDLYTFSFIDNSITFIETGSNTENYKFTMSPNGEQAAFLKDSYQGIFPFGENTIDVMLVDFLSGEVSILGTFSSLEHECTFPGTGINYRTYWGTDDYIYFTICETSNQLQLLKIHSLYGNTVQLLENEFIYTLGFKDNNIEKIVFASTSMAAPWGTIDVGLNETSYHENMYVEIELDLDEYAPVSWLYQVWSPDFSKVVLNGSIFLGGMIGNDSPVAIHIFDTVTSSITQITPFDYNDTYNSVGPIFWVSNIMLGDVNGDGLLNILDIVIIVNLILDPSDFNFYADLNEDGEVNILDVVLLVNIILNP